jgi:hypothetical protein
MRLPLLHYVWTSVWMEETTVLVESYQVRLSHLDLTLLYTNVLYSCLMAKLNQDWLRTI